MIPTTREDSGGVRWSLRLYGALLRVYPREFRDRYRDGLLQTFGDLCRDAARTQETAFFRLWAQTLLDLTGSALQLRVEALRKTVLAHRAAASSLGLAVIAVVAVALHAHNELSQASGRGTFESPEVGMIEIYGGPDRVEIVGVGAEFRTLRYVVATVESSHCDGGPRCSVGGYFLEVDGGWVFLPEDWFTALIPAGTRVLHLLNIA